MLWVVCLFVFQQMDDYFKYKNNKHNPIHSGMSSDIENWEVHFESEKKDYDAYLSIYTTYLSAVV